MKNCPNAQKICRMAKKLEWFAPLLLRLTVGYVFLVAGWGKLHNMEKIIGVFGELGIPFPQLQAPFVSVVEFVGGLCLLLGLGTRIAAIPLSCTMVVAMATAHRSSLASLEKLTQEGAFLYLVMLIALIHMGSGCVALDRLFCRKLQMDCSSTNDATNAKA